MVPGLGSPFWEPPVPDSQPQALAGAHFTADKTLAHRGGTRPKGTGGTPGPRVPAPRPGTWEPRSRPRGRAGTSARPPLPGCAPRGPRPHSPPARRGSAGLGGGARRFLPPRAAGARPPAAVPPPPAQVPARAAPACTPPTRLTAPRLPALGARAPHLESGRHNSRRQGQALLGKGSGWSPEISGS